MIEHKLAVSKDAKPVKQVLRKQSKEKLEFIISEVDNDGYELVNPKRKVMM